MSATVTVDRRIDPRPPQPTAGPPRHSMPAASQRNLVIASLLWCPESHRRARPIAVR